MIQLPHYLLIRSTVLQISCKQYEHAWRVHLGTVNTIGESGEIV